MKQGSSQKNTTIGKALVKTPDQLTPWQIKELKRTIAGIIAGI